MLSVIMDRWTECMLAAWANKSMGAKSPFGVFREHSQAFHEARGMLLILDWDRREILAAKTVAKPFGFCLSEDERTLFLATWGADEITILRGAEVVGRLRHPWFNAPHTIERTARGLLVSSSGTDFLVEIDFDGRPLWELQLLEHGDYDAYAGFRAAFDPNRSYNGVYIPSALNLHVNSAILVDEHTVLATLFGPGELVRIDRRTGRIEVVLQGLRRPHSIRRHGRGYTLCNSDAGELLLLDADSRVRTRVSIPVPWLQDGLVHFDRILATGNRKIIHDPTVEEQIADAATTNMVIELDLDGVPRRALDVGPEHRLFSTEVISEATAWAWAEAWASEPADTSFMRWRTGSELVPTSLGNAGRATVCSIRRGEHPMTRGHHEPNVQ